MHHINLFVCFYWSDSADWRERKTFFESLSFTVINATEIVCVSPCKSVTFEQKVMSQHSLEYFSMCWMCRRFTRVKSFSSETDLWQSFFFFFQLRSVCLKPLDTPGAYTTEQHYGGDESGGGCHGSAACGRDAAAIRPAGQSGAVQKKRGPQKGLRRG